MKSSTTTDRTFALLWLLESTLVALLMCTKRGYAFSPPKYPLVQTSSTKPPPFQTVGKNLLDKNGPQLFFENESSSSYDVESLLQVNVDRNAMLSDRSSARMTSSGNHHASMINAAYDVLFEQRQQELTRTLKQPPPLDMSKVVQSIQNDATFRRLKGMVKSSTVNAQRFSHASLGFMSLASGGWQLLGLVQHGFLAPMEPAFAATAGIVHTLCAAVGIPRLEFDNPSERVRNNLIWPIAFINLWYALSCFTEWSPRSGDSDIEILFSMFDNPIWQVFGVTVFAITLWQVYEVTQIEPHYDNIMANKKTTKKNDIHEVATTTIDSTKAEINKGTEEASLEDEETSDLLPENTPTTATATMTVAATTAPSTTAATATAATRVVRDSIWYDNPIHNALGVYLGALMWTQITLLPHLFVSIFVDPSDYATFASQYEGFGTLVQNVDVNFMAVNNIAVFAATLLRYKTIANNNYVFLPLLATNAVAAVVILQEVFTLGDGHLLQQLFLLIWNGIFTHSFSV